MFYALNCLSLRNLLPKKFHSINKQLINLIADFIIYLLKYKALDVKNFAPFSLKFQCQLGEPFFVPFYWLLEIKADISGTKKPRNVNGNLTGLSCTFIEENKIFISYTFYSFKVISVVDPETFLVTPLWANLKWEFKS